MDLRRIRILFGTWYPWNQKVVLRQIRPLRVRRAGSADLEWCRECFQANHPGSDSKDTDRYLASVTADWCLTLIAEDDGKPVATCALCRTEEKVMWISYFLADPRAEGGGIVTTLFLACLSLLRHSGPEQQIGMPALKDSFGFYKQMGLLQLPFNPFAGIDGVPAALDEIPPRLALDCAQMLAQRGVRMDVAGNDVPNARGRVPDPLVEAGVYPRTMVWP